MNKMKEIAKLLRVNLKEKFKIKDRNGIYWITKEGLFENSTWLTTNEDTEKLLVGLLKGEYEIIREPFVPEKGQEFWYCNFDDEYEPKCENFDENYIIHKIIVDKQLAFRTKEEVFDYLDSIQSQINKKRSKDY